MKSIPNLTTEPPHSTMATTVGNEGHSAIEEVEPSPSIDSPTANAMANEVTVSSIPHQASDSTSDQPSSITGPGNNNVNASTGSPPHVAY